MRKKPKSKIIEDSGVFVVRETESGYPWKFIQFQCPICKTWHNKSSKYLHITTTAKREALKKQGGSNEKTPHLDFYLKNTELIEVRVWKGENRMKL